MKKISYMMISAIIAVLALFSAPVANASAPAAANVAATSTSLLSMVPETLVVEQTATLANGQTVTIYYKKTGNLCEVFSNDNLTGYTINDLVSLKSTSFRVVTEPKGKRVYHTTVAKAGKIIKSLVNAYL
ncbi:MAG: hypothetical protein K2M10_03565 [Muribaculaceae bacterium]|nr:hypothetical protein [Muribaculaceae bacterium]